MTEFNCPVCDTPFSSEGRVRDHARDVHGGCHFFGGDQSSGSLGSHPAGEAIESQPMLGPAPTDAPATVIAYEDPSCPSCARFELGTFPQLKSELIDAIPPFSD